MEWLITFMITHECNECAIEGSRNIRHILEHSSTRLISCWNPYIRNGFLLSVSTNNKYDKYNKSRPSQNWWLNQRLTHAEENRQRPNHSEFSRILSNFSEFSWILWNFRIFWNFSEFFRIFSNFFGIWPKFLETLQILLWTAWMAENPGNKLF